MSGIMLVTADKEMSALLKTTLRESAAQLTLECNGMKSALDVFPKAVPRLVILDLFLPDGSGFDLLKQLRAMDEECLFLLLTRVHTRGAMDKAFRLGAHDVLFYPVEGDTILQTVLHRLQTQSAEEEGEIQLHKPAPKK